MSSRGSRAYRISPASGRGWKLRRDGAARSVGTYPDRDAALARGCALAASAGVDLVIHTDTGTIRIPPTPIRWAVTRRARH
jgi:hypothetical protein